MPENMSIYAVVGIAIGAILLMAAIAALVSTLIGTMPVSLAASERNFRGTRLGERM